MARTRQTARKSVGGMAPRAYMAGSGSGDVSRQLSTYDETKTRTLQVIGEAEFDVHPDQAKLTFKIKERGYKVEEAIQYVIEKITEVRTVLNGMGIENDCINSDSVCMKQEFEYIRLDSEGKEVGVVEEQDMMSDSDDDNNSYHFVSNSRSRTSNAFDNDAKRKKTEKKEKLKQIRVFAASIIIRIHLEVETISKFSETMFTMMTMGLETHSAPVYDLSNFTEQRKIARAAATENAVTKAQAMIESLKVDGESQAHVQLGPPIVLRDVPLNVDDDADESFERQQFSFFGSGSRTKRIRDANEKGDVELDSELRTKNKRQNDQMESDNDAQSSSSFDVKSHIHDLFVVPPLRIMACVPIVFELLPVNVTELESKGI